MPFNENQPRVAAGHENGGQWTAGDASAAIQKAASDSGDKHFFDFISKVQNGEYDDISSMPRGPLRDALEDWLSDSANIRSMDENNLKKQVFLKGVEQRTKYKELYRGESYSMFNSEDSSLVEQNNMFNFLSNNVYVKDKVLDFSKPINIPKEVMGSEQVHDYRMTSYTKNPKIAANFSSENREDTYNSISIKIKNDNGIKGFDISKYSSQYSIFDEAEVVVGDHQKYKVEDVKVTNSENPVAIDINGKPQYKKKLYVTLRQL